MSPPKPTPSGYLGLAGVSRWILEVAAVADVAAGLRAITLSGPQLRALRPQPGQDVMLILPGPADRPVHRRYSIRRFDAERGELELWFVLHGGGPAVRWARRAAPGDRVEAAGPRGKVTLATDADWHLFAGDATFIAAAFAMIEAVPHRRDAVAVLALEAADEAPPTPPGAAVRWVRPEDLALAVMDTALPAGRGRAYVAGEFGLVNAVRAALEARGLSAEQVAAKPYWRAGRANQAHGEPERG